MRRVIVVGLVRPCRRRMVFMFMIGSGTVQKIIGSFTRMQFWREIISVADTIEESRYYSTSSPGPTRPLLKTMNDDGIIICFPYKGSNVVPKRVHHVKVEATVTTIPDDAFAHCRFLINVELPTGLRAISSGAFRDCFKLKMINIPSTVTEIGERAFNRCIELEEMILPQGLQKLGAYAFSECCSLKTINIPPLIQTIEESAFTDCSQLRNVILSTGVREINRDAFQGCESLASVDLPSTLEVVRRGSFSVVGMSTLNLPDSVKHIDMDAFNGNDFVNFRVPPLVTEFDMGIFRGLECIVSIELSEVVTRISSSADDDNSAMEYNNLRNIAFPVGCIVDASILEKFNSLVDLRDLQHRFDGLPVHEICYYHSYRDAATVVKSLKREISQLTSKTASHQDCLGMTPLHILACSTKHDLEMYQLLVGKLPEYLIVEDKWKGIPLLYLFWCNAPKEIIHFVVESYKAIYPQYDIRCESMIFAMANALSPISYIQNLLNTHQQYFPEQMFDMETLVLALAESNIHQAIFNKQRINRELIRLLLKFGIQKRLDSLNNRKWHAELEEDIRLLPTKVNAAEKCIKDLYDKLSSFERIKEATSLLELALWKVNITGSCHKKTRINNEASYRNQCRLDCGAEIIIHNVMPFLWYSLGQSGSEFSPPLPNFDVLQDWHTDE